MLTRGDLVRALDQLDGPSPTVLDAGTRSLIVTHPDELLDEAMTKIVERDIGRLPVVARDDPGQLVGYLGRSSVMAAWRHAAREEKTREAGWLARLAETLSKRRGGAPDRAAR